MTASSTLDVGSTFTVSINTGEIGNVELVDYNRSGIRQNSESPNTREGIRANPTTADAMSLQGHRILVVDDRRDIRFLSKLLLTKAGATVDECEDGQFAVEHMTNRINEANCPDLILLDMQMPNLDGYETARALRKLDYNGPIIALTADAMQGDMSECIDAGCDDYLSKPIDAERLLLMVKNLTEEDPQ